MKVAEWETFPLLFVLDTKSNKKVKPEIKLLPSWPPLARISGGLPHLFILFWRGDELESSPFYNCYQGLLWFGVGYDKWPFGVSDVIR
ncbi:hypothetical protein [Echinicola shivajiensis]|uniref:hypothetical protein n=1 Tax=Echinicola shivajiensis TaxID=1035916 RepID=UPI001BFC6CEB|nr:hypothetical protein [Echinicola shivajiensis]